MSTAVKTWVLGLIYTIEGVSVGYKVRLGWLLLVFLFLFLFL